MSFWRNKNFVSRFINVYDYLVNDINCKYAWRCPQKNIFNKYNKYLGRNHLEIGPGSGYFLKNKNINNLTLIDINQDILNYSYNNLISNNYEIKIKNHNIFNQELKLNSEFDSVGLNYVLHCIPGRIENNIDSIINNLKNKNDYILFGSSVLNDVNLQTRLSKLELIYLNKNKVFHNTNDYSYNLINYFNINNFNYNYKIIGNVILFSIEIKI